MKQRKEYICSNCGATAPKWSGKCMVCGEWETMEEAAPRAAAAAVSTSKVKAVPLDEVEINDEQRIRTSISEFDRVLGGGIVTGSLILVSGDPGIGKSTLLLQICKSVGENVRVLYVSGEESAGQIKLRANRLDVQGANCTLLTDVDIVNIIEMIDVHKPHVVIIDSIQTMHKPEIGSSAGSVTQVRECTLMLMNIAKSRNISIFIVSHVTKEGNIAGPKVLEHIVDCVLYFEGERHHMHRVLRAVKNRYGSTNEIGVFEMKGSGLSEVTNPSQMLLEGRPKNAPGSCVVAAMEGTRPILAELQALVVRTVFPSPRRSSSGIDYNRVTLLMAVLEKRVGYSLSAYDAYINVIGGLEIDEPAADLGVCLSIASSYKNAPIPDDLAAIGEVGLTGEIRCVNATDRRVAEAANLGFTKIILPKGSKVTAPEGVKLIYVDTLQRCLGIFED